MRRLQRLPASLFLGREVNHPMGLKWKLSDLELSQDARSMEEYWEMALNKLRKARAKVVSRYDAGRRRAEFRVGDLFRVRLHPLSSKSKQRSAKLYFRWTVPLKIVRFLSPVTVELANPDIAVVIRKAHVSQVKRHYSVK
jgi:hypothetical protein